ncbi:MAG TPA: hypothetical protein VFK21_03645 [Gammaproteobacteria bacterium]|nr:hypothetical protein [Gammaproteobacteria bacterium]
MSKVNILFVVTGLLAVVYGLMLLWSAKRAAESTDQDWMHSEEIAKSPYNSLKNMHYLMRPERGNISFSKSKGRAYAMIAIGLALIVMAFT